MSVRELLRASDRRFLALAGEFTPAEWAGPSLCDEWSNHEVLAHLVTGYGSRLGQLIAEMHRHRWSFNAANTDMARKLASMRGPAELLDDLARLVDHPQGMGRYFPRTMFLGDHVTHELDICLALDRAPTIPTDALVAVLNAQVTLPNPFVPAFRNSRGLRLIATDADWTRGPTGPKVIGRAAELVSVLGNRPRALARLTGDGVEVLTGRVLDASRPSRRAE
jgi:uncharacterized protein (TIGR03083 family)